MRFVMPSRTLDYALMGVVAGVIAGLVCVYLIGVTYSELLRAAEGLKECFRMAPKGQIINFFQLISKV